MLLLRDLRQRYHIPLMALAQAAGVSHQLISDLELEKRPATPGERRLVERAFEIVIQDRKEQQERLAEEFSAGRSCLLEPVPEMEGTN